MLYVVTKLHRLETDCTHTRALILLTDNTTEWMANSKCRNMNAEASKKPPCSSSDTAVKAHENKLTPNIICTGDILWTLNS